MSIPDPVTNYINSKPILVAIATAAILVFGIWLAVWGPMLDAKNAKIEALEERDKLKDDRISFLKEQTEYAANNTNAVISGGGDKDAFTAIRESIASMSADLVRERELRKERDDQVSSLKDGNEKLKADLAGQIDEVKQRIDAYVTQRQAAESLPPADARNAKAQLDDELTRWAATLTKSVVGNSDQYESERKKRLEVAEQARREEFATFNDNLRFYAAVINAIRAFVKDAKTESVPNIEFDLPDVPTNIAYKTVQRYYGSVTFEPDVQWKIQYRIGTGLPSEFFIDMRVYDWEEQAITDYQGVAFRRKADQMELYTKVKGLELIPNRFLVASNVDESAREIVEMLAKYQFSWMSPSSTSK